METIAERPDSYLRQKGIKSSVQRVSILRHLAESKGHPSVSQIYHSLHGIIPNLSRATVYNTINLFVEKSIVIPVQVDGAEARYDLADPHHAHFHCTNCQSIYDIPLGSSPTPPSLEGFLVQDAQIHYKGLCPSCL